MAAPGTTPAPGMQQAETPTDGRPTGFPPNFQPPANMPNINFSAPVIRLGTTQPKSSLLDGRDDRGGRRAGLGSGVEGRGQDRERLTQVQPQTKEEIIKTIFVGGITEGCGGDDGIERILRAAGNLRRWIRATDADEKPCKFGFAEYEDPESLSTAIEVLKDIRVPVNRQTPKDTQAEKDTEDEEEPEKSTLLIVIDENSHTYIDQYEESIGGVDEESKRMRLDHAQSALSAVLHDLTFPSITPQKDDLSTLDRDGDINMANGLDGNGEAVITIPISADDELSDIPAEMRETVAKEITAFRDRSNRRDLERLKREEEIESQERNRMMNGSAGASRLSRLVSPPPSAPSGPGGANGIPLGPRDRASGLNAPAGPKGFGVQVPRDYTKGVSFVNGTGISTASIFEESDTDASDSELDRRRQAKRHADDEKAYLDQERRWLNRERSRTQALEREQARDDVEGAKIGEDKEAMARRLKEWDDEREKEKGVDEYYADHSSWMRKRVGYRERERLQDEADRAAERRERDVEHRARDRARDDADTFLGGMERERERERDVDGRRRSDREDDTRRSAAPPQPPQQPARFKLSLGAAAAQKQASDKEKNKRSVAEVEGLLEDEEAETGPRRELVKIDFGKAEGMSEEERAAAAKQLAQEIPNDREGLWGWEVKWEFVDEGVIEERLKPFVEKKIVEYLGVQEQMLVDVAVGGLRARKGAAEIVGELEGVSAVIVHCRCWCLDCVVSLLIRSCAGIGRRG